MEGIAGNQWLDLKQDSSNSAMYLDNFQCIFIIRKKKEIVCTSSLKNFMVFLELSTVFFEKVRSHEKRGGET